LHRLARRRRKRHPHLHEQFHYCGGPGLGLAAKLTKNLILSNIMQAINEGLVGSAKAGVGPELMLEILNNSAARCGLIAFKAPAVSSRDFSTNFSLKWMQKDIRLAPDSGKELADVSGRRRKGPGGR
jgi:3-hydroxyisobutyrate dehydrogenase/2-hydroxy-3-oxopropionate reductase